MLTEKNMPFSYQLSQKALNYTRHFSGGDNREQGLFCLFYSLPNRYWGAITDGYVQPLLMEHLINLNYELGLFSSIGFIHPEFLNSSFSQVKDSNSHHFSSLKSNKSNTAEWGKWFAAQNETQPWFSFVYLNPDKNASLLNTPVTNLNERSHKIAEYQKHILETDQYIEDIINTLEKNNSLENTIVFITGSHGALFESANRPESAIKSAQVPLIVLWPDKEPAQITRMTSHLDIVPTLLGDLFNSETKATQYSSGQSLFNSTNRKYILSGDLTKHVIYQDDKITQFSNDGTISLIDWQGHAVGDKDNVDITLLIDVLSNLRRFYNY